MTVCKKCGHAHDCRLILKRKARQERLDAITTANAKRLSAKWRKEGQERRRSAVTRAIVFQMDCNGASHQEIARSIAAREHVTVRLAEEQVDGMGRSASRASGPR